MRNYRKAPMASAFDSGNDLLSAEAYMPGKKRPIHTFSMQQMNNNGWSHNNNNNRGGMGMQQQFSKGGMMGGGMGQMGGHHSMGGGGFGGPPQQRGNGHMGVGQMAAMKAMHKTHHPKGGRPNMHPRMDLMNLDYNEDLMELKHKHHHHHHHHKTEETPEKKHGKCTVERS
jgi:hypothetical protein